MHEMAEQAGEEKPRVGLFFCVTESEQGAEAQRGIFNE